MDPVDTSKRLVTTSGLSQCNLSKNKWSCIHGGVITGGTHADGTVIAILPDGYRPALDQVSVQPISGSTLGGITAQSRIALWTDGALRIYGITGNGDIGIKSSWVI